MPPIPVSRSHRFASRLALVYATSFGLTGTQLPFFPVWLRAIGVDAAWIGIIAAVPAVTRFTALPFVTDFAERRQALRGGIVVTCLATALGLALVGIQHQPVLVFLAYAATCCLSTASIPLIDAYALRGIRQYGLNYGPLRLWGSAAFVVGALACGLLIDVIAATHLVWIIVGVAVLGALTSLGLQPLDSPKMPLTRSEGASFLLRDRGFLAILLAAALIQASHSAYYAFASIIWQQQGYGGLTIAGLWTLGVLAEILLFALSPRFTLSPAMLMVIGAASAVARWVITAQGPPIGILAVVQLMHALSFGLTQVGTIGLMVHRVPGHLVARGQGYLAACSGIVASIASILSGLVFARYGQAAYYVMALMAGSGAVVIWLARHELTDHHPQSAASGG
jgi:MFS transporter, PPP family, 3-phenylpropionic acid transporter